MNEEGSMKAKGAYWQINDLFFGGFLGFKQRASKSGSMSDDTVQV